ncbi:MAG: hypothetical protein WAK42_20515, partial [Mycobacterium sp.]
PGQRLRLPRRRRALIAFISREILTFMLARKRLGNQAGAGRAYAAVERPATYRQSPPVESWARCERVGRSP